MIEYNPDKWRDHLFDIEGSMVREISWRVASCVAWSLLVVLIHQRFVPLSFSLTMHTLVGFAMSMLLVFRTNASYDRYWDGRRLWGGLINDCRNLARSSRVVLANDPRLLAAFLAWLSAYPYSVMNRLRGTTGLGPFEKSLPADERAGVLASNHVPLAISIRLTSLLNDARRAGLIPDIIYTNLDTIVQRLVDEVGGCERIHSTPLPFVYVVHLRRFLIIYCYTLPFALVETYGWGSVMATFVVSYTFFGVEEIGVEIEDPFGHDSNDLPLERYCGRISDNLQGVADDVCPLDAKVS